MYLIAGSHSQFEKGDEKKRRKSSMRMNDVPVTKFDWILQIQDRHTSTSATWSVFRDPLCEDACVIFWHNLWLNDKNFSWSIENNILNIKLTIITAMLGKEPAEITDNSRQCIITNNFLLMLLITISIVGLSLINGTKSTVSCLFQIIYWCFIHSIQEQWISFLVYWNQCGFSALIFICFNCMALLLSAL